MAPGQYPNGLREARVAALLTRRQLAERCAILAAGSPDNFVPVTVRGLENLERGVNRPRIRTAATLAKALEVNHTHLFPGGVDAGIRNPTGRTMIPPDRPKRGKGHR